MPPSLLTSSQLAAFPVSLRRVAKVAADPATAPEDVSDALEIIRAAGRRITNYGQDFLPPLIYGLLDPDRMPPGPEAISSSDTFYSSIACAFRALTLFRDIVDESLLRKIGRDFWPRIWIWIQLMDSHDFFPELTSDLCPRFLLLEIVGHFLRNEATKQVVQSTTGFGVFMAHAWVDVVSFCERTAAGVSIFPGKAALYLALSPSFSCSHPNTESFEEILHGLGNVSNLATLLMRYISVLVRDSESMTVTDSQRGFLIKVLANMLMFISVNNDALWSSLAHAGYVKFITTLTIKLAKRALQPGEHAELHCVLLFSVEHLLLITRQGSEWVAKALQAGLLTALNLCIRLDMKEELLLAAVTLIFGTVARATLHYSSLRALGSTYPKFFALETEHSAVFMKLPDSFQADWRRFVEIVQERILILSRFRATEVSSIRSCSNTECDVLRIQRRKLRRCGACKLAYYCSSECQKLSWKSYNHRAVCAGTYGAADDRDTRFQYFAILSDYQKHRATVLQQKLAYIHRTGNLDFCVVLQYVDGQCTTHVVPRDSYKSVIEKHQAAHMPSVEMHVVEFIKSEFESETRIALALRRSTSAVNDGLCFLACGIPPRADLSSTEVIQEIKRLSELEIVETYDGDANI
ncbi:hypothetical protein R3P38DRAFT_2599849 [Favolaschia claudopus]|uniref:MYND-type domain-containing protein n=1 Tax=Favolaschia claudopus TaxID=2862362 RepID=A0AAW0E341_9AGAR